MIDRPGHRHGLPTVSAAAYLPRWVTAAKSGDLPLKSHGPLADTFYMAIFVAMELPHEPDQPGAGGGWDSPEADPGTPGSASNPDAGQDGITPERLKQVIRRLESGFYDGAEIREHIARRLREDLGP